MKNLLASRILPPFRGAGGQRDQSGQGGEETKRVQGGKRTKGGQKDIKKACIAAGF